MQQASKALVALAFVSLINAETEQCRRCIFFPSRELFSEDPLRQEHTAYYDFACSHRLTKVKIQKIVVSAFSYASLVPALRTRTIGIWKCLCQQTLSALCYCHK